MEPENHDGGARVTAYLGLGANLGDPESSILTALNALDRLPTITVGAVSSLYRTAPVGYAEQPDFLNAVARLETALPPHDLLAAVLHLENQMGRVRTVRWGPRVIDIDVLLYGDRQIAAPGLTVPHPRLAERAFVLVPLAQIAPGLVVPGTGGRTVENLLTGVAPGGNISPGAVVQRDSAGNLSIAGRV